MSEWSPSSWNKKKIDQQPIYADQKRLGEVLEEILVLPPLVTSWEVNSLKEELAAAGRGERFVLQGGDCSESFDDCRGDVITAKVKILLQMSLVLIHGAKKPITRIGRFAGQYAKPRSSNLETRGDVTLPTFRGDMINRNGFTEKDRFPNPDLLLRGYEKAALTLNFMRALLDSGFADLHKPHQWELDFVDHSPLAEEYRNRVQEIENSIRFMETITGTQAERLQRATIYTSHEALHLHYEQAQTQKVPRRQGWYNLSCHMPWIGKRTLSADSAHVEYMKGIENPLGVKVGPGLDTGELSTILDILNPENEEGRISLIHRFGAGSVKNELPTYIKHIAKEGRNVTWICDPMHGNTEFASTGHKTRRFENIISEIDQSFDIHESMDSILGGVHFELTGENVTECTGGAKGLKDEDLKSAYKSQVDPRLNYEQSLEIAFLIASRI